MHNAPAVILVTLSFSTICCSARSEERLKACLWEVGVDEKDGVRVLLEGRCCVCAEFVHGVNGMVLS
jgi:hypothetical protein